MESSRQSSRVVECCEVLCSVVEWSRVELTVDSSRFYSSRVKPSRVVECRGVGSGWVVWVSGWVGWGGFLVGSSRVERSRVEWSGVESIQVESSRIESWSGVEWSQVDSRVESSRVERS